MKDMPDKMTKYQADSLSLIGAVALGTGVMIGAGIFALTGQMAEMTGSLFPLAFLSAALRDETLDETQARQRGNRLQKPFEVNALYAAVRQALDQTPAP